MHAVPGIDDRTRDPLSRIGDRRSSRIGHQRNQLTAGEPSKNLLGGRLLGVLVAHDERFVVDAEVGEQRAGAPRVLARNRVRSLENTDGARRHVAKIPDGGGHQHECRPGDTNAQRVHSSALVRSPRISN